MQENCLFLSMKALWTYKGKQCCSYEREEQKEEGGRTRAMRGYPREQHRLFLHSRFERRAKKKKKSYESRVWRCALRNVERPLTWACVGLWGQGWGVNGTQTVDPDLRSNNKIHLGLTFVLTTAWNNQDHTVKSKYPLFTLYIYIVHNHQQATSADVIWIEFLCKSKIFAQMSKRSNFMNSHCI